MTEGLLNSGQTARLLNVHESTLARWRSMPDGGPLPWVRVGRNVRYRREDVEKVLSGGTEPLFKVG